MPCEQAESGFDKDPLSTMSTFFNVCWEYEMRKYDAKTWSRSLLAASSLLLTSMLLLAACGGTAPGTLASR
jgi:hypothetical protein